MYKCRVLAMSPCPSTDIFNLALYSSSSKWNHIDRQKPTLTTSLAERKRYQQTLGHA